MEYEHYRKGKKCSASPIIRDSTSKTTKILFFSCQYLPPSFTSGTHCTNFLSTEKKKGFLPKLSVCKTRIVILLDMPNVKCVSYAFLFLWNLLEGVFPNEGKHG